MKKIALAVVAALLLTLCSCAGGNVDGVQKAIGDSAIFSEKEIESAMQVVIGNFRRNWKGCTLKEISYDEERSLKESAEWAEEYGADEAIVLLSRFDVDESGGDGSLNPNDTYTRYGWILTRSGKGAWKLRNWGY